MKPFVIEWDQEGFLGDTSTFQRVVIIIRPILSRYSRFFWENFPQLKYKNPQVKFCRSEKKTKAEDILVEFGKLQSVFVQYFVMLITSICLMPRPGQILHVFKEIGLCEPGFD